jgi:hypothetical protein
MAQPHAALKHDLLFPLDDPNRRDGRGLMRDNDADHT